MKGNKSNQISSSTSSDHISGSTLKNTRDNAKKVYGIEYSLGVVSSNGKIDDSTCSTSSEAKVDGNGKSQTENISEKIRQKKRPLFDISFGADDLDED